MSVVRRAALGAVLCLLALTPAAALAHGDSGAHHSLRAPVTDQNFYFVMADRFANGDAANDHGGLPPGKGEGQSGFDPTGKGWYHGGDLKGLTGQARLHQGPRDDRDLAHAELQEQGRPATGQLGRLPRLLDHRLHADRPAPRHQRRPAHARRRRAPRGIKVYFDIITNHTADVIKYAEGAARCRTRRRTSRRTRRPSGTPFDDRDYAGGSTASRALAPTGQPSCASPGAADQLPVPPVRAGRRARRQGPGVAQRRQPLPQPRRHDVRRRELAVRRLLRPRRPLHREPARRRRHDRHLQDVDPRLPHRRLPDGHDEARQRRVLAEVRARDRALREVAGHRRLLHVRRGRRGHQPADPVALHDPRRRAGRARLPVPDGRDALRRATRRATDELRDVLRRRRLVHRRRLERLQPADLPRATTTAGASACSCATRTRARPRPSCWRATGSRTRSCTSRAATRSSTTATSRASPARAATRTRARTCSRRSRRSTTTSATPSRRATTAPGKNDNIGSDETPMDDNFDPAHPLYRELARLAAVTRRHPALRDGAQQHRFSSLGAGRLRVLAHRPLAQARVRRRAQQRRAARVGVRSRPSCATASGRRSTATARGRLRTRRATGGSTSRVGPLSAVVYRAKKRIPRSRQAPSICARRAAERPRPRSRSARTSAATRSTR